MKKALLIISILILIIGCKSNDQTSLLEKLNTAPEKFLINNNADTLIQGAEGTLIYIEKESFTNQSGNPILDSVKIELKEVYKIEDIVAQNISMKSNGEVLETGGMINLKAFSEGDELQLKYGKEIIVHFPKVQDSVEMNLFYGVKDTSQIIEWELEESSTYKLNNEIIVWYTKYKFVDHSMLYIHDGRSVYDTIYQHFNFNESETEELLNKTVDANYVIYENGKMEFLKIEGSRISKKLKRKIKNKVSSFPRCRPYTREGDPIDMPGFFKIRTKVIPPKYKSMENYLSTIEAKFNSPNNKTSSLDIAELQYYIFDSKNLGWMNCDRFINSSSENINYTIEVPKSKNVFAKIVFTNYKTVMTGDEKKGKFIFENLPIGEPIKVVVLDEKRGKPLLKIIDTKVSKEPFKVTNLTEYSLEELQQKLKELN